MYRTCTTEAAAGGAREARGAAALGLAAAVRLLAAAAAFLFFILAMRIAPSLTPTMTDCRESKVGAGLFSPATRTSLKPCCDSSSLQLCLLRMGDPACTQLGHLLILLSCFNSLFSQ